ncbi:MAG: primase-like DNA-binding domain-containing protein [Methyloligellaceae bacterium]
MRIVLSGLGVTASLVMLLASCLMNYLFLSSLGKSPLEAHVLGAVSASADSLKALLPFFIAWGWRSGRYSIVVPGIAVWVLFSGFSLLSALGFSASNRGAILESRNTLTAQYERLQSDLKAAQARISRLPQARAFTIVEQEINRYKQHVRWTTTKKCVDATIPESREYCRKYFSLRSELAAAKEYAKLQKQNQTLKDKISRLRSNGAETDSDPQVSLLSRIFGQSSENIRLTLTIIVALLVELGSSLGLYLSASHSPVRKRQKTNSTEKQDDSGDIITGEIEDFCLACLKADECSSISLHQAYASYQAWCNSNDYEVLELDMFSKKFHHVLAKEVGIPFSAGKYQGITLNGSGE